MLRKIRLKKVIIIFFVLASILSIIYIFFQRNKTEQDINTGLPLQPQLKSQYKGTFTIEMAVKEKDFVLPKVISPIKIAKSPLEENYINNVSKKLGFSGEPSTSKDIDRGTVLLWRNENTTFFVYPNAREMKFISNKSYDNAINKNLSDDDIKQLAKSFLIDNEIFQNSEIEILTLNFLKKSSVHEGFDKTNNKNEAIMYQILFYPNIAGQLVVTKNISEPLISVSVLKDGSIWGSQIHKLEFSQTPLSSYKTTAFTDIVNSVSESKLISLTGAQTSAYDLSEDAIKKVVVTQIKIAYLLESYNSEILTPIFLLEGQADVTSFPDKLNAVLYLPAISDNL